MIDRTALAKEKGPAQMGAGEPVSIFLTVSQTLMDAIQHEELEGGRDPDTPHVCNIWNTLLKRVVLAGFVKAESGYNPGKIVGVVEKKIAKWD